MNEWYRARSAATLIGARGAFYANFDSKDAVFLELVEDRMARSATELGAIFEADTTTERRLASFQECYETAPGDDIDWAILDAEFWLYAQRHPAARQQLAALQRSLRAELAALISDQLELAGVSPPLPSDELAAAAMALDEGLVHQRRTDPDAISPDLLMRTLSLFVTG